LISPRKPQAGGSLLTSSRHRSLVVSTPARRPRKSAYIASNRAIYGFCPLTRQSDALPAPKSIDQNQGSLIWRADLAENKEAKF
jgi:hypothetical protein